MRANNLINHVFYTYIRILLINTISVIYICCIKHEDGAAICVLAVRDSELDVGDSEVVSSEVAGAETCAGSDGKTRGHHVDRRGKVNRRAGSGFPGNVGSACQITSEITCLMAIFVFYSLKQIQIYIYMLYKT